MPKVRRIRGDKVFRPGPLAEQVEGDLLAKAGGRQKERNRRDGDDQFVERDLSARILWNARRQLEELSETKKVTSPVQRKSSELSSTKDDDDDDDEDEEEDETQYGGMQGQEDVDPEDVKAFQAMLGSTGSEEGEEESVLDKYKTQRTEVETVLSDGGAVGKDLPPMVVTLCQETAGFLKQYRSGKLPKFLKRVAYYEHWEECIRLMRPEDWSAASIYAVTKIFSSNLGSALAQRFYNLVLLPRFRDDIKEYKRLNFHIMQALKKSLFKSIAFFRGIVLPLCQEECTVREATIISSLLRESTIQAKVSGTAIEFIAKMDYTGPRSIILRTLLDKKYALAYSVVDSVHASFMRYLSDNQELTTLWHQCLLTFIQRHKNDFTQQQKAQLLELVSKRSHPEISAEIRRELSGSQCRPDSSV